MGFFIPLITDRFGKCVAFPHGKNRINLFHKIDRDTIDFKALFLTGICDENEIENRMKRLEEVFVLIDDFVLVGHLWYIYLIGYILNVKMYIMDFSCAAHFDATKRSTRLRKSRSNHQSVEDSETKDPNTYSVADLRNRVAGGGKAIRHRRYSVRRRRTSRRRRRR